MNKLNLTEKQVAQQFEWEQSLNPKDTFVYGVCNDWLTLYAEVEKIGKLCNESGRFICKQRNEIDRYRKGLREAADDIKTIAKYNSGDGICVFEPITDEVSERVCNILQLHFPELSPNGENWVISEKEQEE